MLPTRKIKWKYTVHTSRKTPWKEQPRSHRSTDSQLTHTVLTQARPRSNPHWENSLTAMHNFNMHVALLLLCCCHKNRSVFCASPSPPTPPRYQHYCAFAHWPYCTVNTAYKPPRIWAGSPLPPIGNIVHAKHGKSPHPPPHPQPLYRRRLTLVYSTPKMPQRSRNTRSQDTIYK
jgi:hypothetical protein